MRILTCKNSLKLRRPGAKPPPTITQFFSVFSSTLDLTKAWKCSKYKKSHIYKILKNLFSNQPKLIADSNSTPKTKGYPVRGKWPGPCTPEELTINFRRGVRMSFDFHERSWFFSKISNSSKKFSKCQNPLA